MLSTIAIDIRDFSLSPDGKNATFVLVTKHSGEIAVTIPAECLAVLRAPSEKVSPNANGAHNPAGAIKTPKNQASEHVTVTVPKKWYVAGNTQKRLVITVLDPTTPGQSGFALGPQAAREFAAALVKKADEIAAGGTANKN